MKVKRILVALVAVVLSLDTAVLAHDIGVAQVELIELGGGRRKLSDSIDPTVGLEFLVRIGDTVEPDAPLVRVFARPDAAKQVEPLICDAFTIDDQGAERPDLIHDRIA